MMRGIGLARIFQQICRNSLDFLLYCSVSYRLNSTDSVQYKLQSRVITDCGIRLGFCHRFEFVRYCFHTHLLCNLQLFTDLSLLMPKEYLSLLCLLCPLSSVLSA